MTSTDVLHGVMTPANVGVMTPDRYDQTLTLVSETIAALRELAVPPTVVHSIDVQHWYDGSQVGIHINGQTPEHVGLVDLIGDHYGLPADDGKSSNYTRGRHLGKTPVLVFCGRPELDTETS